MNLKTYLEKRSMRLEPAVRPLCTQCRLAAVVCDCARLKPFDARIKFVILIHPEEVRRRIATGRLSHLMLKNSDLIEGESFEACARVQSILRDEQATSVVLYPGAESINLSHPNERERLLENKLGKSFTVFVIDGTWRTAKKMLRLSPSLAALPKVSFDPPGLSRFEIRKQPARECLSTLEAIHHVIELLGPDCGFDVEGRAHDHMLELFDRMVDRQIDYQNRLGSRPRFRGENATRS